MHDDFWWGLRNWAAEEDRNDAKVWHDWRRFC